LMRKRMSMAYSPCLVWTPFPIKSWMHPILKGAWVASTVTYAVAFFHKS
jgi:hypothetical protein